MAQPYEREVVRQETSHADPVDPTNSNSTDPAVPAGRGYSRTAVTSVREGTSNWRATQMVWWIVGLVDILIAIRFVLKLFGASTLSSFVRFMYDITAPLVAPFHGIFNTTAAGASVFEPESLVAIGIYSLIGWGIVSLVRLMTRPRRTTVVD